jgi:long-subunit acyl-CoA synthetase (AMP-forming)
MAKTVMEVFDHTASAHAAKTALRVKRDGYWVALSWSEYHRDVRRAAKSLIKLGLEPGKGVSIIGYNCPEWFIADMAAIYAGAVPAGIYTTNSPEQCQYIAHHCEAQVAVVENAEQLAKFKAMRSDLPHLKAIVMIDGEDGDDDVYGWNNFLALGDDDSDDALNERVGAQKADDLCTLIYTSGTTGPPKAVMINHHNITWTAQATVDAIQAGTGDQMISYLPLSHVAEQIVSLHAPVAFAGCVSFAESLEKLGDNLREIRPHYFLGVPRVWEKIQAKIEMMGAQNSSLKKKISAWARAKGLAGGYAEQQGKPKPFGYGIAEKIVFSKVRAKLGLDRCRMQITAAAPISKFTLEFFLSLGIPIYEVYGMSECSGPATISLPHKYVTGKAGFELPGTEIKIIEETGEICMRGPHVFQGYLKNEEVTNSTLDAEGWLHSGDVGEFDEKRFLSITDRIKDLLITAGGENIAPQLIEGQLKSIPAVSQAIVVGDRKPFLSALLTLNEEKLASEAAKAGSSATNLSEAGACEVFNAYIQKAVDEVNTQLARVQTIKKFTIVPAEFTVEGGEMTPTMKVKRKVVREKYANEISSFYE